MKIHNSFFKPMFALALMVFSTMVLAENPKPSGTLQIDETEVMAIIGGATGGGKLNFKGAVQDFKVAGLTVGAKVGIEHLKVSGEVYYLTDINDFPGVYFEAEAAFSVVEGAGAMWLKNDKGVTLHLKSSNEGLAINIGADGLKIEMK